MSTDWIKLRVDLREDPAVFRLAKLTKQDRLSVVGRLWAFWSWADKHAVDGRIAGADVADVDEITEKKGFAQALRDVGWLEVGEGFVTIPKHHRHTGESAKERSLKNARQARWRQGRDALVDAGPSTSASTSASTASSTTSSTPPSTRVDKSREEKKREEKELPEPSVPPSPALPSRPSKFPPGFEAFWDAYPRKVGKDAAVKAYARRRFTEEQRRHVIAAIAEQRRWEQWTRDGGQFVPHPATWLNEGRWQDESPGVTERADRFAGSTI